MTIEAWEDGLRVKTETIDIQGNDIHREMAYKFDGRDYLLKGSPLADRISAKRINLRTSESIWKKGEKNILTVRTVVSVDGQILNVMRTGTDAHGRMVDEVLVYERQWPNALQSA